MFRTVMYLYMGNALLILLWNYAFFGLHSLLAGFLVALLVLVSVLVLFTLIWRTSQKAALLLAPYLLWMLLATYLMYMIWMMNK